MFNFTKQNHPPSTRRTNPVMAVVPTRHELKHDLSRALVVVKLPTDHRQPLMRCRVESPLPRLFLGSWISSGSRFILALNTSLSFTSASIHSFNLLSTTTSALSKIALQLDLLATTFVFSNHQLPWKQSRPQGLLTTDQEY